jgi:hypothetical protein
VDRTTIGQNESVSTTLKRQVETTGANHTEVLECLVEYKAEALGPGWAQADNSVEERAGLLWNTHCYNRPH